MHFQYFKEFGPKTIKIIKITRVLIFFTYFDYIAGFLIDNDSKNENH